MRSVTRDEWVGALQCGDIGLCLGRSLFARLQDWYRREMKESDEKASHGFYVKAPPHISEADGWKVNGGNDVDRYFSNHHKIWIFRCSSLTPAQLANMNLYIRASEETGGIYSWGGIGQLAKRFILKLLGKTSTVTDKRGVFCTEYTSRAILAAEVDGQGLPYITDKLPQEIDPAVQLDWFLDVGVACRGWVLAAYYKRGKFFLP